MNSFVTTEKYITYAINRKTYNSLQEAQSSMEAAWRLIDVAPPRNADSLITGYPEEFHGLQNLVVQAEFRLPNHGCLEVVSVRHKPKGMSRPATNQYRREPSGLAGFRLY